MRETFIHFPLTRRETAEAMLRFKETHACEIPQVVGAIDGTHVEILSPCVESKADYYSRKQIYSVVTQAVVGGNLEFLSVATGFPGNLHDGRVFRNSEIFQQCENEQILSDPIDVVEGVRVRPLIIEDSAYPLKNDVYRRHLHATLFCSKYGEI